MAVSRRLLFQLGSGLWSLVSTRALRADEREAERGARKDIAESSGVFAYGVASGDPLPDRVILWTHVDAKERDEVEVQWQVALDPQFEAIVSEGWVNTQAMRDFTVKVDARLPYAETSYFYRFRAHGVFSPTGRTRTAPREGRNIRLAVVSCSSIWSGYFNAYERLSRRGDLDLIIHCGDYAYDVPDPDEQRNMPYRLIHTQRPTSLADHRQRYRYYRSNALLQAAHQQHPFAIIWDNHDILTFAPRSEAIQAFWEWQPVRPPSENPNELYRTLDYGSLLKIHLLDARHIGRGSKIPGSEDLSILGEEQLVWLKDELRQSRSRWNLIVNQVLFSSFTALGKPLSKDAWQGYPKDVERVKDFLREEQIPNTVIVTGDAHLSFACNIESQGVPVGVEFLPTSVSRGNLDENVSQFLASLLKGLIEGAVKFFNPHIRYFESEAHGYGIVDLKAEETRVEFWYVDHEDRTGDEYCARVLTVADKAQRFTNEKASPTPPKAGFFPLAPAPVRLYEKGLEIGGKGGDYFDGEERLTQDSRLSGLMLRTDSKGRVKALAFRYSDGRSWQMGQSEAGARDESYTLEAGEYLRVLRVGLDTEKKNVLVSFIELETSDGRRFSAGRSPGETIEFRAPAGRHIVSFHGRSGASIDKLGPIFAPDFG